MFKKITQLTFISLVFFGMSGCGGGESSSLLPSSAPYQVGYVGANVYASLTATGSQSKPLFDAADAVAGSSSKCDVQLLRMSYATRGGAGEATTSSGVIMLPTGSSANCSGKRPTLLYAHGTSSDSRYDLSQLLADSANPAASEAVILLALYASRGYIVIAPNYAGYADSSLGYHPYIDEAQQVGEMQDALAHVQEYSTALGINMSPDLFVSGLSQGGYVAMATHKALQAKGVPVRASVPISGPYAMLNFLDTIMTGYVNGGATLFAPMYLTALEKSHDIYTVASEVYSTDFAATAETALPRAGGHTAAVTSGLLPATAIFSGIAPALPGIQPFQQAGFGSPHLLSDAFRTAYLADAVANPSNPVNEVRALVKDADLRDPWTPTAPLMMCGSQNDPVVYFTNTQNMVSHWKGVPSVLTLNLDAPPAGPFAAVATQWQVAGISGADIHGQTGVYCGLAAYGLFQSRRTQ
ncbi:MAG TPA: alpha/beta hydrolase [Candidatus Thiothrix moscowensis]|uniref:alpha/beta hydrolase family protein n=1 Tax=unclassified Thiothrix TaxID=2636184 RepID=UPI0025CE3908|nr:MULTISPECIES: alpha/beta hydrolase [unclassified Thiothrix]HRJ53408.1 alpha/beta hydrolase [Candidatus Thiothrix moscowensis]HRJ93487.1 alpha/beta hydrolase [Candidatus Thiothrix moscowensis]